MTNSLVIRKPGSGLSRLRPKPLALRQDLTVPALVPEAPLLARGLAGALTFRRLRGWEISLWSGCVVTIGLIAILGHQPGALGALGGLLQWAIALRRNVMNRWFRRQFDRHKVAGDTKLSCDAVQRFTGVVCNGPTFDTPLTPRRAVLGRFFGRFYTLRNDGRWQRRPRSMEELCGVDFDVRTQSGQLVRVRASEAYLVADDDELRQLGTPATSRGHDLGTHSQIVELWNEEVICPGQSVELLGVLEETIDPEGVRDAVRGPPVLLTLRAPPGLPLLVRQVFESVKTA